jgi:hypothetical protein
LRIDSRNFAAAEELTDRVEPVTNGRFSGIRFFLELPATVNGKQYKGPFMHRPGDDDSAGVTFWGQKDELRELFQKALVQLEESAAQPV